MTDMPIHSLGTFDERCLTFVRGLSKNMHYYLSSQNFMGLYVMKVCPLLEQNILVFITLSNL